MVEFTELNSLSSLRVNITAVYKNTILTLSLKLSPVKCCVAQPHILKVYMKIATERKANQSHDRCPGDVARQSK